MSEAWAFVVAQVSGDRLHTLARLMLALVLGGLVGIERERKNQPAGFRTHVVLCVGAALMMLTSIHVAEEFNTASGSAWPIRRASRPRWCRASASWAAERS